MSSKATPQAPSPGTPPRPETLIGPGVHVKGDLQGKSNFHLRGTVEGNVLLEGRMVIADGGRLVGDISATSVIVEGELTGNIQATEKVQLGGNARMKGNIRSNCLSIQDGATFEGSVSDFSTPPVSREPRGDGALKMEEVPVSK